MTDDKSALFAGLETKFSCYLLNVKSVYSSDNGACNVERRVFKKQGSIFFALGSCLQLGQKIIFEMMDYFHRNAI